MQAECLNYEMLLERSKEKNLPFSNLLGGAVLEEVVRRISESEYGKNLWLKNKNVLGIKQYEKKLILSLEYDHMACGEADTDLREIAKGLKENVFEGNVAYGVSFSQKETVLKKYLFLQLFAKIEDMRVPVSVKIYPLYGEKRIPEKEIFSCMMFPEIEVCYNCYIPEEVLAEKYVKIVTKLELIQDMGVYYDIYCLLGSQGIDGRKVREYIDKACEKNHISRKKDPLETIESYKNYPFMKKKWKVFLRSISSREPSWEAAVGRFLKFFKPIWKAVMGDYVFFGDWMPELDRFL